jgi:hypothetical protein
LGLGWNPHREGVNFMKSNLVFKLVVILSAFVVLQKGTQPVSAISVISSHTSPVAKQNVEQLLVNPYPCYFGGCQSTYYLQAVGQPQVFTIGSIVAFGGK